MKKQRWGTNDENHFPFSSQLCRNLRIRISVVAGHGRVLDDLPSGIDSSSERNRTATINSGIRTTRLT